MCTTRTDWRPRGVNLATRGWHGLLRLGADRVLVLLAGIREEDVLLVVVVLVQEQAEHLTRALAKGRGRDPWRARVKCR